MMIALVLAFSAALAAPASAEKARIDKLIEAGKLDEAVAAGRSAVRANPKDADLRVAAAKALATKGRSMRRVLDMKVTEEQAATGVARLGPVDPTGARLEVVYDPALFEEAILEVGEAIRVAPKRKDLRLQYCYLLTDAGRIERASTALRETISALPPDPRLADELAAFGAERMKRGDATGGVALLRVVATAFPNAARVQADYAMSIARTGRKTEALLAIDRGASLAPADLRIQRMRATLGLLFRDFERSRSAYERAARLSRQETDRLGMAAASYGKNPRSAEADFLDLSQPKTSADPALVAIAQAFSRVVKAGAGSEEALSLADRLRAEGQTLLAIPVVSGVLGVRPRDERALRLLVSIYNDLGFEELANQAAQPAKTRQNVPSKARMQAPPK